MKIDSIVNLTDAELINKGFISEVVGFADEVKEVKRGFLFLSNNPKNIQEAVKKGAYAIIFSENIEVIDDEIAWIKVESLEKVILEIFKYYFLDKKLYFCDEITLQMLKSATTKLIVIDSLNLSLLNYNGVFVSCLDKLKNIAVDVENITQKASISLLSSDIFRCEIEYNKNRYEIEIAQLYFTQFQKAVKFLEQQKIEFCIKNIKIDRLSPIFINSKFEIQKFGQTEKVIIKTKYDDLFINELNYIIQKTKYAILKCYDKFNIKNIYKDKFNFGLVIDEDVEIKVKQENEQSLL